MWEGGQCFPNTMSAELDFFFPFSSNDLMKNGGAANEFVVGLFSGPEFVESRNRGGHRIGVDLFHVKMPHLFGASVATLSWDGFIKSFPFCGKKPVENLETVCLATPKVMIQYIQVAFWSCKLTAFFSWVVACTCVVLIEKISCALEIALYRPGSSLKTCGSWINWGLSAPYLQSQSQWYIYIYISCITQLHSI